MSNTKKLPKKNALTALVRLLKYINKYKGRFIIVLICILLSAIVGVISSTFV